MVLYLEKQGNVEGGMNKEIVKNSNETVAVLKSLVNELLEQSEYTEQIIQQSGFVFAKFN